MSEPFIGEIRIFAGNFAPRGWAFCDGQLLQIATNTALFSILGTTYGGDGSTTFGLPDLRGRAAMHEGNGPGLTLRRLGERGGVENVTLTQAQLPSGAHSHALRGTSEFADSTAPEGSVLGVATTADGLDPALAYGPDSNPRPMDGAAIGATQPAGASPHNNMQPSLATNFIIALVGIFPSRS